MTIIEEIRGAPMTRFQTRAVALCLAIMFVDGYDIAVMAFAAPTLSQEWQIEPALLGYLLSASLFGQAAGSFLLTPLADRIGRRPLAIIGTAMVTVGMFGSVLSPDVGWLLATRIFAGLGIGAIAANLSVLVAELSSERRRGLAMGILISGVAIGATVCGLVAAPLIPAFGWRSIFIVGASMTLVMFLLALRALPESIEFLISKRPEGALRRVNAIMAKLGRPALTELPPASAVVERAAFRELFNGRNALRTLLLWIGFGLMTGSYYFMSSWIPKLMTGVTGDPGVGTTLGTVVSLGGIVGAMGFGALAAFAGVQRLTVVAMTAAAVSYFAFALVMGSQTLDIVVVLLLGIFIAAGSTGFYAVGTQVYATRARATGMGWMVGVGRLVSVAAPILVGYLVAAHVSPSTLFMLFALPALAAGLCVLGVAWSRQAERRVGVGSPAVAVGDPDRGASTGV